MKNKFEIFCDEFSKAVDLLGLKHIRFTLHEGMSADAPVFEDEELKCAGLSAYYPSEGVGDIWYDPSSGEDPRYIAWHEAAEIVLTQLRLYAKDSVKKRKWNEEKWDELAHEVINRLCSSQGHSPVIEFIKKGKEEA